MPSIAGEELIPFGNPLAVTVIVPVNPFTAFTETLTGKVAPAICVEAEAGEISILKSAVGGGGGGEEDAPHPFRKHRSPIKITSNRKCFKCLVGSTRVSVAS